MALSKTLQKFYTSNLLKNDFVIIKRNLSANGIFYQQAVAAEAEKKENAVSWEDDWGKAKPYKSIPGPRPLPIPKFGNLWRFSSLGFGSNNLIDLHKTLMNDYGPIVRLSGIGQEDMVFLYDPNYIEVMFRNETVWPIRDGLDSLVYYRKHLRKDVYEGYEGVVAAQGKKWAEARSAVNQTMMQPRNAKIYTQPIDQVANDFINRMRQIRNENLEMPKDFSNELNKWALESIAMVALDTRLGVLEGNLDPNSNAQKMITAIHDMFDCIFYLDVIPLSPWRYISTPTYRKYVKTMDTITDIAQKYVNEKMEKLKNKTTEEDYQPNSVLEQILFKNENSKFATVMAMDMLTAGVDTTANSAATTLYYLAKNPEVQEKLFAEANQLLPTKTSPITNDVLNEMKYLKAVIKESMRMSPIAPGNQRTAAKDLIIAGYQIPKGTRMVSVNIILTNLEKHYKKSDQFRPERWLKSESDSEMSAKNTNPFVFLPFGFGPRMCVGRRFAELELETILTKIVRNFKVEYNHGEMEWKARTLYYPGKPLQFRMEDRKN